MPLLVASISAYLVSALILKRSLLTERIARRGLHPTREYSTDPLEVFFAREVMTAEPIVLRSDELLRDVLVQRVQGVGSAAYAEPALYPIVDRGGAFVGVDLPPRAARGRGSGLCMARTDHGRAGSAAAYGDPFGPDAA